MPRRDFLGRVIGAVGCLTFATPGRAAEAAARLAARSVREFGAAGDGVRLDTGALQAAIDACAQSGGGTVLVPPGRYLTGSLFLRSRVRLVLETGATLLGSRRLGDYQVRVPALRSFTDNYTERALIYGENLDDIAIEGGGVIEGQGAAFRGEHKVRPFLMRFVGCRNVTVRGITLKDAAMWVQHYLACDDVWIDGVRVASACNNNNDGLDIDGCERVRIANCDIRSGDDAIVLKSTLDRPCRNVVITNCILSSKCSAFKLGSETTGGFENIALSNCAIYDTGNSGIALEMVDGGTLERVSISNVTMRNARNAIFIRLGNRARPFTERAPKPGVGRLRHVRTSHVQATGADPIGCCISGIPGHPVEDIALDHVSIRFAGGGKPKFAHRSVPELEDAYPEYWMFGALPAYGFFCRHARGLRFSNVTLDVREPDTRPSLICREVSGVELFGWRPASQGGLNPVMVFDDVEDAFIHGCTTPHRTGTYLRVEGPRSARIRLVGNELADAARAVELGEDAAADAVKIVS